MRTRKMKVREHRNMRTPTLRYIDVLRKYTNDTGVERVDAQEGTLAELKLDAPNPHWKGPTKKEE